MQKHKTWDDRLWEMERACLTEGGGGDGILTDEHRRGWLRCLRSRRVILVEKEDADRMLQPFLEAETFEESQALLRSISFNFKNLPFEEFTIMINDESNHFMSMSVFPHEDNPTCKQAVVTMFFKEDVRREAATATTPLLLDYSDNTIKCVAASDPDYYKTALAQIPQFSILQHCLNQLTITRDVVDRPHKPQLRKQKQGKWEVFHKVVDWTAGQHGRKSESRHTGTTKCFHTRRGHYRRLASGKEVWVRETTAGSISKGIVEKTYRITADKK